MKNEIKIIKDIIGKKRIYPVYQPIIDLNNNKIYGYEALSRIINDEHNIKIEDLFSCAEKYGMVWELEELCRKKALKNASQKPENKKLFINVNPNVILDKTFESGITTKFIGKYKLQPEDIVLEITERTPIQSKSLFKKVLKHYTEQGYSVAIDDFGSAYAGLDRLFYIKPDFLKLDVNLIRDIENDETKKSLVKHLVLFCKEVSIKIIAEGIETENEANVLKNFGVDFGQGFYYAKPSENFLESLNFKFLTSDKE